MKGKLPILLIGTLTPLLSVGTATAAFMPGGIGTQWQQWVLEHYINPLAQLQQDWSETDPILETMMQVALGGSWDEMKSTTDSTLPDPYKVRTAKTPISSGVLTTNPVIRQRDVANLYDQELGRAMAAPIIGQTGRETLQKNLEQTSKIIQTTQQGLQETQKLAQQSQSLRSTQDVMKSNAEMTSALAGIVTNQAQLTADSHRELLKLQQLQGTALELSANTSEGIDESNRRDRVNRQLEIGGMARTELYVPGLYNSVR